MKKIVVSEKINKIHYVISVLSIFYAALLNLMDLNDTENIYVIKAYGFFLISLFFVYYGLVYRDDFDKKSNLLKYLKIVSIVLYSIFCFRFGLFVV